MLVARARVLQAGKDIANAHLIDIAPTLLHLLGVSVPEDMDGHVLTEAFQASFLARNPVRSGVASGTSQTELQSGYTDEESAKVEERLQALGYLE
jgi:arylsulfatase A-like enzyme